MIMRKAKITKTTIDLVRPNAAGIDIAGQSGMRMIKAIL